MALTEEQKTLIQGLIEYGVEKEAVPFLMAGLQDPQLTETMIDFLLDNPKATREEILSKIAELIRR